MLKYFCCPYYFLLHPVQMEAWVPIMHLSMAWCIQGLSGQFCAFIDQVWPKAFKTIDGNALLKYTETLPNTKLVLFPSHTWLNCSHTILKWLKHSHTILKFHHTVDWNLIRYVKTLSHPTKLAKSLVRAHYWNALTHPTSYWPALIFQNALTEMLSLESPKHTVISLFFLTCYWTALTHTDTSKTLVHYWTALIYWKLSH